MSHNASSRTCGAATWSQLTCRPETAAREVEFGRGQPPGQATDQSCASNNWNGRRRRVAADYERQATIRPASNTCSYDRHPLIVKASHARSTRFASPGIHLTAVPRVGSGRCRSVVAVLRNNEVSMLSRARIEGRPRPPRVVNPYIRAPAPTCTYDGRTSRPIPTSPPVSGRTDRGVTVPARGSDGRARRTRRPDNPYTCRARSMTLILLWRTPKIWTVIDIRVVSQHANAADVTTAQRGVPLQALHARAPTTIRPAVAGRFAAPRVVTSSPLRCRSRARLPHSANVRGRTFAPLGLLLLQKAV